MKSVLEHFVSTILPPDGEKGSIIPSLKLFWFSGKSGKDDTPRFFSSQRCISQKNISILKSTSQKVYSIIAESFWDFFMTVTNLIRIPVFSFRADSGFKFAVFHANNAIAGTPRYAQ